MGDEQPATARERAARRRRRRLLPLLLALVVVIGLGVGVVVLVGKGASALSSLGGGPADYSGTGSGSVEVVVQSGDTAAAIARRLEAKDVVKSAEAFRDAAAGDQRSRGLQPGTYRLHEQMSASAALSLMLDPASRVVSKVVIPEGTTAVRVLQRIAAGTDIPLAELQRVATARTGLGLPDYARSVEGFLWPATYDFQPGTTAQAALRTLVQRWQVGTDAVDLQTGAAALGRSPYDVLTVASLCEAEARFPEDYPRVARVVYNRLAKGMPLQLDSTVNYVLEERKGHLSLTDLQVDSAYNTYTNKGLPPTPIDSPGERALRAALAPAEGDWIYFVATDKAGHEEFTADYDEFLRLKKKGEQARG